MLKEVEKRMKITDIQETPVSVPQTEPEKWKWGKGGTEGRSSLILKVKTDEGITGTGEIVGIPSLKVVRSIYEQSKPVFIGKNPFNIEEIIQEFYSSGWHFYRRLSNIVIAGMEMALWDIIGKSTGEPIHNLLGGGKRKEIPFAYYIPNKDIDIVKRSKKVLSEGFETIFMKIWDPSEAVNILGDLREEVGEKPKIRVDANEAWNRSTAVKNIERLKPFDLEAVEQPISIYDLEGAREIRKKVSTPIIQDQSCIGTHDTMKVMQERAADIITIDPYYVGGLLPAKKLISAAEMRGYPVALHSYGPTGPGTASHLHLLSTCTNNSYDNQTHLGMMESDLLKDSFEFEDGKLEVPEADGLGIILDEEEISKYNSKYDKIGDYSPFK